MMEEKPANTTISIIDTILTIFILLSGYLCLRYYEFQVREVVAFSQLSVCTKDGVSLRQTSNPEGTPLFHVPKEINQLYICGTVETPFRIILGMNLFKVNDGEENVVHHIILSRSIPSGPFVYDVISTEKLDAGEYRAELSIGRVYKGDVWFSVER
jgi:hypothetical protein